MYSDLNYPGLLGTYKGPKFAQILDFWQMADFGMDSVSCSENVWICAIFWLENVSNNYLWRFMKQKSNSNEY